MFPGFYYIHFEITGYPYNLIGSQQCDLFPNRTVALNRIFISASDNEAVRKTKQPIRFQGFF